MSPIDERMAEREDAYNDLREREVVALEQIGKSLILIEERQSLTNSGISAMSVSVIAMNQSMAVLIERHRAQRGTDK